MTAFQKIIYAISAIICAILVVNRIWVAEDAYITFRSIENLYSGLGLVFNSGERIEASTHPLWMLLLIIIKGIGIPLHFGSILLGLLFTGIGIVFVFQRDFKKRLSVPITALMLCSISGFRDFSTAGMEYSLVFFLLVLFVSSLDSFKLQDRVFYHALLLGLLYLARPELAILWVYYSIFFIFEILKPVYKSGFKSILNKKNLSNCAIWLCGFLCTAGVYHLFRWFYYNDIFPNTYYAKAGLSSYYIQGLKYLVFNLTWSPTVVIALSGIAVAIFIPSIRNQLQKKLKFGILRESVAAFAVSFYIIRVGGDFMSFRFLLPEFILIILTFSRVSGESWIYIKEKILHKIILNHRIRELLLFVFIISFIFWPVPLFKGYIADERRIFTNDGKISFWQLLQGQNHKWGKEGRRYGLFANCLGPNQLKLTNSMTQARCMEGLGLGYFGVAAGSSVFILDEQALPNRSVADLPVLYRWRPGHEHYVDLGFVLANKSTFCSSQESEFDRIMKTKYGILLNLDREILSTIPDISNRLKRLVLYKQKTKSPIIERLEVIWGVRIEALLSESLLWEKDPLFKSRNECWEPGF